MIIRSHKGQLLVVRQVDHQVQCGLMAVAWGNEKFARPKPKGIYLAARWHDQGWSSWEEAPRINQRTQRPLNFTEISAHEHIPLYREGIAVASKRDPYMGILVSLHGEGLQLLRLGLDGLPEDPSKLPKAEREFIVEQSALRTKLKVKLDPRPKIDAEIAANFELLKFWDRLSLYMCWQGLLEGAEIDYGPIPLDYDGSQTKIHLSAAGPNTVALNPYPFARSPLDLTVQYRAIDDRNYCKDGELRKVLSEATWQDLDFKAVAAGR